MKYKVVIVSSGQPSANPRAVKEAILLAENNYEVTLIYCPISKWADSFDKIIFEKYKNIKWIKAGYHFNDNYFLYNYARARNKIWALGYKIFNNKFNAATKSSILFYQELNKVTQSIKSDLYIGHNLGALPVIINAAKKYKAKCIFDFEDFHRGEHSYIGKEWAKIKTVEDEFAIHLDFAFAASPLIAEQYSTLYNNIKISTTNNCFPINYSKDRLINLPNLPIKLFWFSQTLGKERGVEIIIKALGKLKQNCFELTLLGNHTNEMKNYFDQFAIDNNFDYKNIKYLEPVFENEIVTIAANHHIGIASELQTTVNRDICLTNKIFMYLLAGNAIIFSKTKGQELFLNENKNIGLLFDTQNEDSLSEILDNYLQNSSFLNKHRIESFNLGKTVFNWDIEKKQHLNNIVNIMQKSS